MSDFQPDYFRLLILPLLLPFGLGIFILVSSWKIEVSRYIGFLTLKPVFAYPIWFLISWSDWFNQVYDVNPVLMAIVPLIPGIILTLIIVYLFRHLFGTDKLVWLFLIGDIIRWGNTFIFTAFTESNVVSSIFIFLVFFGLYFPSVYVIVALISVSNRVVKQNEFV